MPDDRIADLAPAAENQIEHAGRQSALREDLDDQGGGERRQARRFEDDGIARHERGRDFPNRDRDGKVPRRDDGDGSDRLLQCVAEVVRQLGRNGLARDPPRLAREEFDDVDGALDFAARLGQRLALFPRERFGQLLPPLFHAPLDLEQDLATHRRGRLPPSVERVPRRVARLGGLRRGRGGRLRDDVAYVGGIDVLDASALGFPPVAADEVLESSHRYFIGGVPCTPPGSRRYAGPYARSTQLALAGRSSNWRTSRAKP